MSIDFNQLREFVEAIAKTDITELTIKEGDFELILSKNSSSNFTYPVNVAPIPVSQEMPPSLEKTSSSSEIPPDNSPKSKTPNWVEITSPMVGTFYQASAPNEPSFVEVGDRVSKGQVVCIIEAMKLMNEIEAEVSGEIIEIVAKNGEPLEYGQVLMRVNPS